MPDIDIAKLKREAKLRRKNDSSLTYMQHLDIVSRQLYGVRHYHEAKAHSFRQSSEQSGSVIKSHGQESTADLARLTVAQYYMRSLQEYYLDI